VTEDPALDSLEARLAAARKTENERSGHRREVADGTRSAVAGIASTMIGYPMGGAIMGFVLDTVLETRPWLTIGLLFFAFFCACVQVFRSLNNQASSSAAGPNQE
jgi:ATP synthase protein I